MHQTITQRLTEALQDEYKSRATYRKVIEKFGPVRPFINIVEAEGRHVDALLALFEHYQIPVPEDRWLEQISVPDTRGNLSLVGAAASQVMTGFAV
jgi:hypothetical protein